ncbi:MAG: hypothetical protein LBB08_01425, partial [Rickettsiales bacterium]|nr:hypothetical protein [Rickettsiales bacterium]
MIKIAAILLLFCNAALGAEYVACRGISDSLKQIQVMAGVSTGAAGVGTLTGAAAVITGIAKNAKDTQLAKLDTMKEDEIVALWKKMKLAEGQIDGIEKKKLIVAGKLKEQSQTLGNVRTVTLGATTATSAVAAVSAGFGVKNVDDLIGKMNSCNEELKSLENIQLKMRMEGTAETDPEYSKISNIL